MIDYQHLLVLKMVLGLELVMLYIKTITFVFIKQQENPQTQHKELHLIYHLEKVLTLNLQV